MNLQLRPFTADDYDFIADINNTAYSDVEGQPTFHKSAAQFREADEERQSYIKFARWVAEVDGHVVGLGEYDQASYRYDRHKFFVDVFVAPAYQGHGIGPALYNHVESPLRRHDPVAARGMVREDLPHSIAFLNQRGWNEAQRIWESKLDLATLDLDPFNEALARLQAEGIAIKALPELAGDPPAGPQAVRFGMGSPSRYAGCGPPSRETLKQFIEHRLNNARVVQDAYFVAVDNDAYVGITNYNRDDTDAGTLLTNQTGVARAHRRKGIALALKVHSLAWAKQQGYTHVLTNNASVNRPMLSTNEQLGFVKNPAWIDFVKVYGGVR